jgi:UDP-N-acetyl-2-amino-2-deoxyglucuronate dehydrogenase
MKKKILNFGVLGLGRVVENRIYSVLKREVKGVKVLTVFDKNKKKNNKYSKLFKCDLVYSFKEFLEKDTDFVYIATESGNHFNHILRCFKANKNVIVEKPPVLKVEQLIFLDDFSRKKNLKFYTVFQNRHNRSVNFLQNNFKKFFNEKIVFINLKLLWSRSQDYYSNWHGKWKLDGGVLAQQGIHYIDLLCYFLGKPIKCVSLTSKISNKLQAEDTHVGIVKFRSAICSINLTTALRPKDYESSIEFFFKRKVIKLYGLCCNKIKINFYNKKKTKYSKISNNHSQSVPNGYGLSHKAFFDKVIEAFYLPNSKIDNMLKAINSLNTLKLLNMLYQSSEKNKWVLDKNKNYKSKLGN